MGYNLKIDTINYNNKGGLESNVKDHKTLSEACTHRPSLP